MIIGIVILYTLKLQDTIDTIEGTLVSDCVESSEAMMSFPNPEAYRLDPDGYLAHFHPNLHIAVVFEVRAQPVVA